MMLRLADPPADAPPTLGWDDSPCPLCGRRDDELVLEAPDANPGHRPALRFAVVRCRTCDLHYTNPRPDVRSIGRFYPTDYAPHRRPGKLREAGNPSLLARLTGRACPERDGTLPWAGQGRLLDFGCGGGGYLKRMSDQGWRVTGLDTAAGAVRRVQHDLGLRALAGTLPHPKLHPCSFDVVTMWQTLEHVHRPLETLREAWQVLVPGGRLVVACPNRSSWAARAFGPDWFGLDLPRHLTHFDPATLTDMLTAAGFAVRDVRLIRHSDWLRSSARLATARGNGVVWQRALTAKPVAKLAAAVSYAARRSDCMVAVAERPG